MTGSGRASRKMSSASATEWLLPAGWRLSRERGSRKKATLRRNVLPPSSSLSGRGFLPLIQGTSDPNWGLIFSGPGCAAAELLEN